jgi:hypothetical protein
MTAEIVIMNKEAVVLAADSAVTSAVADGQKIFTSADKIFALSDHHPVGIMFYHNAYFMGIPWDTIAKSFRSSLSNESCDTLEGYVRRFISFCETNRTLFSVSRQKEYVTDFLTRYFLALRMAIEESVKSIIDERGHINAREVRSIVSRTVTEDLDEWRQLGINNRSSISMSLSRRILSSYYEAIEEAINIAFHELPISRRTSQHLLEIARYIFHRGFNKDDVSGVVFAWFGDKEIFPSCISMTSHCVLYNRLKYTDQKEASKIGKESSGNIIALAQSEMVARFMNGIDPLYLEIEQGYMSRLPTLFAQEVVARLDRYTDSERQSIKEQLVNSCGQIIEDFNQQMIKESKKQFADPITKVVSLLPKSDLGALAEALVHLTVIKRRFSLESETVAEPIDVAMISKGDGFIWIRRKHYFQPDLNPGFFARRYRGG